MEPGVTEHNAATVPAGAVRTQAWPPAGAVLYGGDYNPEQWPRDVWQSDARLMREAGVNLVTVGVFSWADLEPAEGRFEFGWLRDVLDLMGEAGIGVDLATPTAAPPPWLTARYPDVLPVDDRGCRYSPGSRQHFCVCSPRYLKAAQGIVTRLADELGDHEALRMWHVHNEYACHVPYCYCEHHARAFRSWLEERYGSIAALNEAWGTSFWSQRLGQWSEVIPPRRTPTLANPGQLLDFRRFCSDAFLAEFRQEKQVLRQARPDIPVTTNFMGFHKPLDYFAWAQELDVVSTDNYPDPADPDSPAMSAMHYDMIRSLNKAAPWLVMEQTTARVNWRERNVPKAPGQMRALSYQALARGASGVLFFQWRASRAGAEKFHSAMLSHSGQASPVWSEVVALGQELAETESLGVTPVQAPAAVVFSWPNWWAVESPASPAHDFRMLAQLRWLYRPLYRRSVTVDFCQPAEPLGRYQAVLVPSLYLVTAAEAANIVSYVAAGGTAVISFWSGIVDEHDQVYLGPYGGPLRPLIGCDVLEVAPLPPGEQVELEWADGGRSTASFWLDIAAEREAGDAPAQRSDSTVLARVASGPWAGRPAVVQLRYGQGTTYYLGARLDEAGLARIYDRVPALSRPSADPGADGDVERVLRAGLDGHYEFLINHAGTERQVRPGAPGVDLLSGRATEGGLTLGGHGVAIVRRKE